MEKGEGDPHCCGGPHNLQVWASSWHPEQEPRSSRSEAFDHLSGHPRRHGLGEEFDSDEAYLGVPGVLEIVDHRIGGRVRQEAGVTLLVATDVIDAVRGALLADPALDHGPEVMAVMKVEGPSLAGLETYFPDSHLVIPEQEAGSKLSVAVSRLGQLTGKVLGPVPTLFNNLYHAGKASFLLRTRWRGQPPMALPRRIQMMNCEVKWVMQS